MEALISATVILFCIAITQTLAWFASEKKNYMLNYLAAFVISVQWMVWFFHASGIVLGNERTEKYYDLTGSLTFLTTIALSLILSAKKITRRQIILSAFVVIWASRLGWFLFTRIHKAGGIDTRFTEIKEDNFKFLMTWTLQGTWVFICLLPVLKVSQHPTDRPLATLDYVGMGLWTFGFAFEVIADYQKSQFRANPDNKNKFIDSGLWSISRHPNYFGEILLWLGITLSAFSGTRSRLIFITPVFVAFLLIFVSGIPMLEKKADDRYGNDEEYQKYKENTPTLIPFIGMRGNSLF